MSRVPAQRSYASHEWCLLCAWFCSSAAYINCYLRAIHWNWPIWDIYSLYVGGNKNEMMYLTLWLFNYFDWSNLNICFPKTLNWFWFYGITVASACFFIGLAAEAGSRLWHYADTANIVIQIWVGTVSLIYNWSTYVPLEKGSSPAV